MRGKEARSPTPPDAMLRGAVRCPITVDTVQFWAK